MNVYLPTLLSSLVVIVLVSLLNNLCFVAYARLRLKWLEKKNLVKELGEEVQNSHDLIRQQKEVIEELRRQLEAAPAAPLTQD
ncbi:hypothetical protein V9K67_23935 [Paraflavisolibacter sp. H34]|uniref:hypothetical protein n=1 Tax=Huijunlia imazamoxiresistens TaxID=3127457 RepID=UPI003017EBDB